MTKPHFLLEKYFKKYLIQELLRLQDLNYLKQRPQLKELPSITFIRIDKDRILNHENYENLPHHKMLDPNG